MCPFSEYKRGIERHSLIEKSKITKILNSGKNSKRKVGKSLIKLQNQKLKHCSNECITAVIFLTYRHFLIKKMVDSTWFYS